MAGSIKRDTALGVVFFLGIAVLLWATAKLGSLSLQEKQTLEVHVPNARGLKVGDNVEYLGTKIGVVSDVDTEGSDVERQVRLFLRLDREVKLRDSYKIRVADASLLGGKVVAILPGKTGDAIDAKTSTLVGVSPPNPLEALGDLLGGEANAKNLANILRDISAVVTDLREGKGVLGEMINSARDFFKSADKLAVEITDTVAEARKGEGEIGKVITNAGEFFDSGTKVLEEARNGDGLVARFINDKELADDTASAIKSIRVVANDFEAGRGVAGKLFRDKEMEDKLVAIVDGIDVTVKSFNSGDGLVNAILNDGELTASVKRVIENFDAIVADARAGKGTIGRLLTDDTIANQIESLLNQVMRVLEDAREAAPVSTFVSIFTGVFQ